MTMFMSSRRIVATSTQILMPMRAFSDHKFLVPDRGYLEISGKDLTKFLQGVCTNDVHKLKKNSDCIAAAFLTPKGRVLADALLYYYKDASEKVKIVVETHISAIAPLTDYLSNYKLRSKVKINHSMCYSTVLTNSSSIDSLISEDEISTDKAKDRAISRVRDPRIFSLGIRSLYNDEIIPVAPHAIDGEMLGNSSVPKSADDYNRLRLLNGLTEGPEIVNRIPLECNLDLLNYIDFTKGCYVGQELTARTKFKGLVRKRILPFLRSSLHPQYTTNKILFCEVDSKVIKKKSSSVAELSNSSSTPEGEIGTIYLPKMEDDVDGFDLHIGEVVSTSIDGDICCALVRLENVLPITVGNVLPEFRVKLTANSNDAASGNANDAMPIDIIMTPVVPIRPPYWVEKDPVTNHRLDTHAD